VSRPCRRVRWTPSVNVNTPEATQALYSPLECPAKYDAREESGIPNSRSSVRSNAIDVMQIDGWELLERVSSSCCRWREACQSASAHRLT